MAEAKTTVTVRTFESALPTVHEADKVTIDEGRLHLESSTGLVAVYAPGAWASATRTVGVASQ